MMHAVNISFIEMAAMVHAEKHFTMKTPMSWELIAEYVLKFIPVLSGKPEASPDTTEKYFQCMAMTVFELELLN